MEEKGEDRSLLVLQLNLLSEGLLERKTPLAEAMVPSEEDWIPCHWDFISYSCQNPELIQQMKDERNEKDPYCIVLLSHRTT